MPTPGALGRRRSPDDNHVTSYPLRLLQPVTVTKVEKILQIPGNDLAYRKWYDQGAEGACCGFACSWMATILNHRRYNAVWLYREAQAIDPWHDTPPGEGTDVRSAFEIMRTLGHRRMWGIFMQPAFLTHGIAAYRWATTVDELRTSIALNTPSVLGVNWYQNFDTPVMRNGEWWVGVDQTTGAVKKDLGPLRGGHGIVRRGSSDKRQAGLLTNNWGPETPDVWMPYEVEQRLIGEDGEAGLVSDR